LAKPKDSLALIVILLRAQLLVEVIGLIKLTLRASSTVVCAFSKHPYMDVIDKKISNFFIYWEWG
jgi:hypothetical protein